MGYYNFINTSIKGGHVAESNKINDIQASADEADSQPIMDLDGSAFLLDDSEDALIMSPITNYVDIHQDNGGVWQLLRDLYIRRKLDIQKNGIYKISVYLKNTLSSDRQVVFNIFQDDFDNDYTVTPLASQEKTIPANTPGTLYDIYFNLQHLNREYHYLEIDRSNVDGVFIEVTDRELNQVVIGEGLEDSPNGVDWTPQDIDLHFTEYYANTMSYDVVDAVAMIAGCKLNNLDTHVTVPSASTYADRMDMVVLQGDGTFDVIQGIPSNKPVISTITDPTDLIVAHLKVPQNAGSTDLIIVNQDDTTNEIRKRSQNERLRRIEKKQNWDWKFNPPVRLLTERTSNFMDGASTGIEWVDDHYEITSKTKDDYRDTYKTNTGINTAQTSLDHSNHTDGIVKLPVIGSVTDDWELTYYTVSPQVGADPPVVEARGAYFRSSSEDSRFIYNVFYSPKTFSFNKLTLALGRLENSSGVYLRVIDYNTDKLVKDSQILTTANYHNTTRGNNAWQDFHFSSQVTLQKGRKYRILIIAIPTSGKCSEIYIPCYNSNRPNALAVKAHVENRYLTYPHNIGYMNPKYYDVRSYFIPMKFDTHTVNRYASSAWLVSNNHHALGNIGKVTPKINIDLDDNTGFTLQVSNDGGASFHTVTGSSYTFGTVGADFIYKIQLTSADGKGTPIIQYDDGDAYAVDFMFDLSTGGTPINDGILITTPFNMAQLCKDYFGVTRDIFSHLEWLLTRFDAKEGTVSIDIQKSDNGTDWSNWMTGLNAEFVNMNIDYNEYDDAVDPLERNLYCDYKHNPTWGFYWENVRFIFHLSRPTINDDSPRVYMVGEQCILA
jgi:hypothetical protein